MARLQDMDLQSPSSALASVFVQSPSELDCAWEGFLSGAPRDSLLARNPILDSWERCRASDVGISTAFAPQLALDFLDSRRREHRPLLRASAETLAEAADILTGTDAMMLITDPAGIVLDGMGDNQTLRAGTDIALCRGGDWREGAAGTNGIGVAIATARPMMVHAGEHYCEPMKKWSCAAAPIIHPGDGSVAGVLNISARSSAANGQMFALAVLGARRIEMAMMHEADQFRARLLEVALEQGRHYHRDGLLAVDEHGRLAYASSQAARMLRDRLGVRMVSARPGQRAFDVAGLPREIPNDWIRSIEVDGGLNGFMVVIPTAEPARSSASSPTIRRSVPARRHGDESDPDRCDFTAIVGDSPSMKASIARAQKLAPSPVPILIQGETGVGKELFARAFHGRGPNAAGPLVMFNCGAANREMIASELFGYARGAFTGASNEGRPGRFELAHGGTLCLDEIGELALDLQPYLLRVLEEGVVSRIGEGDVRRVDVRVIAMTNRDLHAEVAAGRFRRDLLHRLAVASVTVPPLRDRGGDIDLLLERFSADCARRYAHAPVRFTDRALAILHAHDWPGNVRELRNVVETASLLATDDVADEHCLPDDLKSGQAVPAVSPSANGLEEREQIANAIAMAAGNMSIASTMLGLSRSTLYRKILHHNLSRSAIRDQVMGRGEDGA